MFNKAFPRTFNLLCGYTIRINLK